MENGVLPTGRIVSVQVGRPKAMKTAEGRDWRSAIVKLSVAGPVALEAENVAGDEQADKKHHGGPDKAVCAYASEWLPLWKQEFGLDFPGGAFGENLTLQDLTENELCVGDTLIIGSEILLQISQPRQPCANVSKRWAIPALPRRMEETGYTGFYCRVLRTGTLEAGQTVEVTDRPYPDWTLLRANQLMYAKDGSADAAEITALRDLPHLSAEWKRILGRKLNKY